MQLPKFRIGESDRVIGESTNDPEGFTVLNLITQNCFVVSGGVWAAATTVPDVLVQVWNLPYNVPGGGTAPATPTSWDVWTQPWDASTFTWDSMSG